LSVTYKRLSNGRVATLYGDDPDNIARQLREKELEIQNNNRLDAQRKFLASPEYQPGEEAPVGEEIGAFGKASRGVLNALVTIPTEISATMYNALAAAGYDEGEIGAKNSLAIKDRFAPEIKDLGAWAEIPKALVQFGVPGGLILKSLGNANKATKLLAVAAAEGMVAEEDMKSFGDTFLPNPITKTKELEALDGQERAFAALYNKGVNGLEAAAIMAGIPLTLTAAGAVVNTTAKGAAKIPGVKQIGQGAMLVGKGFSKVVDKAEKSSPLAKNLISSVRFRGKLPDKEVAEIKALKSVELGALGHTNLVAMNDLSETLGAVFKQGKVNDFSGEKVIDALNDYLYPTDDILSGAAAISPDAKQIEAAKQLIEMDKAFGLVKSGDEYNYSLFKNNQDKIKTDFSLFRAAANARQTIDDYTKAIQRNPEFVPEGAQETLEGQVGLYGATQYRMFLDDEYLPPSEVVENAIKAVMKGGDQTGNPVTREEAVEALTLIKSKGGFANKNLSPEEILSDETLKSVMKGPLLGKKLNDPAVKEFLGEYTARRELPSGVQGLDKRSEGLLSKTKETIGRQAAVISQSNYFKRLEAYNNRMPEGSKMFLDSPPEAGLTARTGEEYAQIPNDIGYGPLRGKYIREDYFTALEQTSANWNLKGANAFLGWAFGTLAGAKGMLQKAVTVYNPEAQMRNTVSALGFAIANGNVPRGKDVTEAFSTIYGELGNKTKSASAKKEILQEYIDRGVVGTQAQLGEINSMAELAVNQTNVGAGKKFWERRVKAQDNFMTQLYRAGDDVWKVANYEIEKKKLLGMVQKAVLKNKPFTLKSTTPDQAKIATQYGLDPSNVDLIELSKKGNKVINEFISEEAAYITRNNVPNYSRVPTAVQNLRQLPLGNFIAYPAEIIRTSFNVVGRGITELASDNADMRARGIQRLLGYSTMAYGAKEGIKAFSLMMTGANNEELESYKRSFAQEWEKNSTFATIRTNKKGNILEAINLSYTLPYDYVSRPIDAVLNAYNDGIRKEEELYKIALNGVLGAVDEFTSPFIGREMLGERLMGAIITNENQYGQELTQSQNLGDRFVAGTFHLMNGLIPPMAGFKLATDKTPFDTVNYNVLESFKFGDLSQAALVESGLIPREKLSRIKGTKKLDLYREAGESITAFKVKDMSPRKIAINLRYKAQEFKKELGNAINIYNAMKNQQRGITQEEFRYNFEKSNDQQYKLLRDFSILIQDARELGVSDREIARVLRLEVGGVRGWQGLMNNTYTPAPPKASVAIKQQEVDAYSRRNVVPVRQLVDEVTKRFDQKFPEVPVTPAPSKPMADRLPGLIQETVESIPDTTSNLYNRARQFLRSEEEKKLMGGS
jgi:hypothetical protein